MQNKLFLKAADICELLEVKQTSAYWTMARNVFAYKAFPIRCCAGGFRQPSSHWTLPCTPKSSKTGMK